MAPRLPQRRTLGLALLASVCLHFGVGLSIFMPAGLFASASPSSQVASDSEQTPPENQPEPPPPDARQPPRIRLGIERSSNATVTWLGFETPTEHEVPRESDVEQAALAPDTAGGQASGLPDALTMVPTPVAPPPSPSPSPSEAVAQPTQPTPNPATTTPQTTQLTTPELTSEPTPPPNTPPMTEPAPPIETQAQPQTKTPPSAAPLREVLKILAPDTSTSDGPIVAPAPALNTLVDVEPEASQTGPAQPEPAQAEPAQAEPAQPKPAETQPQPPAQPAAQPHALFPETPPSLGPRPAPTSGQSDAQADGRKVRQRLKSEKESPAAALKRAVRLRPGRPAAVEGLDVKTVEPSFPTTLRFTSNPRNPVVVVNFNRRGRVVSATFLTDEKTKRVYDTGDPLIDNYLMTSLYLWTAKGKELEALPADNPEMVVSIVIEVTLR